MKRKGCLDKAAAAVLMSAVVLAGCGKEAGGSSGNEEEKPSPTEEVAEEEENDTPEEGGTSAVNPWRDCTEAEAEQACEGLFLLPEGAELLARKWMEGVNDGENPLVELDFSLDGMEYCARAQQNVNEDADISSLYYDWSVSDENAFLSKWGMPAKQYRYNGQDESVELISWYDPELCIAYALSTRAADLSGFDIQGIAEQMYYLLSDANYSEDIQMYQEMLSRHGVALYEHWDQDELRANNMSGIYALQGDDPLSVTGFAFLDLNDDGVDELLIGAIQDIDCGGTIYDIYTLLNGSPVHVASGGERDRFYIPVDGTLVKVSSGSSTTAGYRYFMLDGEDGKLLDECWLWFDEDGDPAQPWKCSYNGGLDWVDVSEEELEKNFGDRDQFLRVDFIPLSEII